MEFAGVEAGKGLSRADAEAPWRAFPRNSVVAVFSTRDEASQAQHDLLDAGVPLEALRRADGAAGAEKLDPAATDHWMGGLMRMIQNLGDVRSYLETYARMVKNGGGFLAVRYEEEEERDKIVERLRERGALRIGYTAEWTFTSLL